LDGAPRGCNEAIPEGRLSFTRASPAGEPAGSAKRMG